jgi:signal transduction histidine kinase
MAIARRLVEAHGGQITVGTPTNEGRGAEIVIVLPREGP